MSERGSVDLDLLADYVGGALAGTPEEAHVAQLIAYDPAWRHAADDLAVAFGAVAMDMDLYRSSPEPPMPPDVAVRLDEALAQAAPAHSAVGERVLSRGALARDAGSAVSRGALERDAGSAVSRSAASHRGGVPAQSKARRWAAPLALAMLMVAVGVVLVPQLLGSRNESPITAEWGDPEMYGATATIVVRSGKHYTAESFPDSGRVTGSATPTSRTPVTPPDTMKVPAENAAETPAGLERLAAPAALADCLRAVGQVLPGKVQWVDLAYYDGRPAALVILLSPSGRWVFVAEPSCGIAGPAEIYRAALG